MIDVTFADAHAYYAAAFRGALAISVLALYWVVYQVRVRQIARTLAVRYDERADERARIARELHDTLLQSFQGLVLRLQSARDLLPGDPHAAALALDQALHRADQAIAEGRDVIQNLRSSAAAGELAASIAAAAEELQRTHTEVAAVRFRACTEGTPRDLHPLLHTEVYRIACEAVSNAYRHAHARHIEAEVSYGAHDLRVRVRDDGRGIRAEYLRMTPQLHWGLISMRERARQIGSELTVFSGAGIGTEVEIRVPSRIAYAAPGRRRLLRRVLGQDLDHDP